MENICDVIHLKHHTPPQFPAKCGSGVPFFIYFDAKALTYSKNDTKIQGC